MFKFARVIRRNAVFHWSDGEINRADFFLTLRNAPDNIHFFCAQDLLHYLVVIFFTKKKKRRMEKLIFAYFIFTLSSRISPL